MNTSDPERGRASVGRVQVKDLLEGLVEAPHERGLEAAVGWMDSTVRVRNPATGGSSSDPRCPAYPLRQRVQCRVGSDGQFWWTWVWGGPPPNEIEREPMVPAGEIATAADKIARVLAAR